MNLGFDAISQFPISQVGADNTVTIIATGNNLVATVQMYPFCLVSKFAYQPFAFNTHILEYFVGSHKLWDIAWQYELSVVSTDEKILDIEPWDSGDAQSSISDNIYINKRKDK